MAHHGALSRASIVLPVAGLLSVVAAALLAASAQAATIAVDALTDSGVAGSTCELREAITSANNDNAAGNGCANGNGADTINVTMTGTITLSNSPIELSVDSDITIIGQGMLIGGTKVTQGTSGRIFHVTSPNGRLKLRISRSPVAPSTTPGPGSTTSTT